MWPLTITTRWKTLAWSWRSLQDGPRDKIGLKRYGFCLLPMDESLARVVLDLGGGRTWCTRFRRRRCMCATSTRAGEGVFRAFANSVGANVHIQLLYGEEPHHVVELCSNVSRARWTWRHRLNHARPISCVDEGTL